MLRLQQSLPKLWLFGLYGALGGLLGALVFGEALWAALSPPSPPPAAPTPPLQIAVSPAVSIYRGGQNRFSIKIARHDVSGPVTCEFRGLPSDLTIAPVTIAANESETQIDVKCATGATLGDSHVVVAGSILNPTAGKPLATAEAETKFVILQPEPRPELRLAASESVVVDQSRSNRFTVKIARDDFTGPVKVELHTSTPGITCPAVTIPAEVTDIELEVSAAADAKVGVENAKILAHGPMEGGLPSTESAVKLTVNTFTPPPPPQVDIMFVLDVTSSMQAAIDGVREGILDFAKQLEEKKLDARIGLVAFRDLFEDEPSELLRFGGETFTKDYAEFRRQVANLEADGGGDIPESSLDAIRLAARQPFRQSATRVILLITDAPPKLPDRETQTIEELVEHLRTQQINQLHLVAHRLTKSTYTKLQAAAPGQFFDLQDTARGGNSFASLLPELSKEIARITIASQPPAEPPPASGVPKSPPAKPAATIAPEAEAPVLKGVQSERVFAADQKWRLLAAIGIWTSVIAAGTCVVLVAGQHYYLRQTWPGIGALAKAASGGLLAGLIGGAAGQFLFQLTTASAVTEILFRLLGWSLLGSLAGLGTALFVPNLRVDKGILGGALGGLSGAAGYVVMTAVLGRLPGGEIAARLLGAVLLGFCIGLMLAWAERAFRTAWLEIKYGEREIRAVNLGPEPVSIGSDSRVCTVYARNAPPVAFKYWVREGKVVRQDVASGVTTDVRGGETQNVGALVVSVRTSTKERTDGAASTSQSGQPPAASSATRRPVPPPPSSKSKAPPPPKPAAASARTAAPAKPAAAVGGVAKTAPTVTKPATPPPPKSLNACPSCGRTAAGTAGQRYCRNCNKTF